MEIVSSEREGGGGGAVLGYQIPEKQELSGTTILMPGSDTYNTVYVYASRNIHCLVSVQVQNIQNSKQ